MLVIVQKSHYSQNRTSDHHLLLHRPLLHSSKHDKNNLLKYFWPDFILIVQLCWRKGSPLLVDNESILTSESCNPCFDHRHCSQSTNHRIVSVLN